MGFQFAGYAAVFNTPCSDGDIFAPGCFTDFLKSRNYLCIPMLTDHVASERLGIWLELSQDDFGLFVVGELAANKGILRRPYPGLAIKAVNSVGQIMASGGELCNRTMIEEISLVTMPKHPDAWVIGPY